MTNNKKAKRQIVHEINATSKEVKRENRLIKQKTTGDKVVKWIFAILILLAIAYMIWATQFVS